MMLSGFGTANPSYPPPVPWTPPSSVNLTTAPTNPASSNLQDLINAAITGGQTSLTTATFQYYDGPRLSVAPFTLDTTYSQYQKHVAYTGYANWNTNDGDYTFNNIASWNLNNVIVGANDSFLRDYHPYVTMTGNHVAGTTALTNVSPDPTTLNIIGFALLVNNQAGVNTYNYIQVGTVSSNGDGTGTINYTGTSPQGLDGVNLTGVNIFALTQAWAPVVTVNQYYSYYSGQAALIGPSTTFAAVWPSASFTMVNSLVDSCNGSGQEHVFYLGRYGLVDVTNAGARWTISTGSGLGDVFKSRAKVTYWRNCFIDARSANVGSLLEFPDGGNANVLGGANAYYGIGSTNNNGFLLRYGFDAQGFASGGIWIDHGGTNELHVHGCVFDFNHVSSPTIRFSDFYVTPSVIDVTGNTFINVPNVAGWAGSIGDAYLTANNTVYFD